MLDHRHGLGRDQVSSFNPYPAYQMHSNCDGTGDIEFDFWSARKTWYYNNLDGGCQIEPQVQACVEESFASGNCSSPETEWDASPLLTNSYFPGNLSPTTRTQTIEEGRKELMEMICKMPESSYELSLKDLVDLEQHGEALKVKAVSEEKSFHFETKKKKKRKASPISRTASMEADSFLIKMFSPSFLSFKKKSIAERTSKVSPNPPCEGSEKPVEKQKRDWIKRIFIRSNDKNREDSRSSSNNNNSKSRYFLLSFIRAAIAHGMHSR